MAYSILQNPELKSGVYSVVPLREKDIMDIMLWRNEQLHVLRQKAPLTAEQQIHYYNNVVKKTFGDPQPSQMLFSFLFEEKCIGYGGLTNISWQDKRCELSFLLNTSRTKGAELYTADFSAFIQLMKRIVFNDLHFNRIFTETYNIRPVHIGVLEKEGFMPEGRLREHVCIEGSYEDSLMHGFIKSDYHD